MDCLQKKSTRIEIIDILKGIGILLMIFDHVGWGWICHTYIQSFHMPLFFIVSGFLYKKRSTLEECKKRFQTLMIPYLTFGTLYLFIDLITSYSEKKLINGLIALFLFPTDIENMPLTPALWFFPCMYIVDCIYNFLTVKFEDKIKIFIVLLFGLTGMIYSNLSEFMLAFALEPVASGVLFFLLGDLLKHYGEHILKYAGKIYLTFGFFCVQVVCSLLNNSCDMRSARYHNIFLYLINAILGTFVFTGISLFISKQFLRTKKFFIKLSENPIVFICMNQVFIRIWLNIFNNFENMIFKIIIYVLCFVLTIICCLCADCAIQRTKLKKILGR